jgi:predicted metal-dependent peptidase
VSADGTGITVVTCDADARRVGIVRTPGQVRDVELRGGGGTDMTVGIEECALMRPRPEVVVVMTDGYTPWPARAPAGLESATVIALLTTGDAAASVPCWIRTIAVEGASRG